MHSDGFHNNIFIQVFDVFWPCFLSYPTPLLFLPLPLIPCTSPKEPSYYSNA